MLECIHIERISANFFNNLKNSNFIIVHSIFDKVINIELDKQLYCLQLLGLEETSISATTNYTQTCLELPVIVGEVGRIDYERSEICFEKVVFNFANSEVTYSNLSAQLLDKSQVRYILSKVSCYLEGQVNCSGILLAKESLLSNEVTKSNDLIVKRYSELLLNLKDSLENENLFKESLYHFIGLGHGLTPSGDDFVLGMLSAFQFCANEVIVVDMLLRILVMTIKESVYRTTDVSRAYLLEAVERRYSRPILLFYQLLVMDDKIGVDDAIRRMVAVGHSSGSDTLCGIYMGFVLLNTLLEKNGF